MFEDQYAPRSRRVNPLRAFTDWLCSDPPESFAAQAKAGLVTAAIVAVLLIVRWLCS